MSETGWEREARQAREARARRMAAMEDAIDLLRQENDKLRELSLSLANRVCDQSDLLSRRAEKFGMRGNWRDQPVTTKARMYTLMATGAFGNTTPVFFGVADWHAWEHFGRFPTWLVRSLTPGGPCRAFCPTDRVEEAVAANAARGHDSVISPMADDACTMVLWAEVMEDATGLRVYGIEHPPRHLGGWRDQMPSRGREWRGVQAAAVLQRHLNPSSLADLRAVLDRWPGHVVELGVTRECFGTVPGRNAMVWEVRMY